MEQSEVKEASTPKNKKKPVKKKKTPTKSLHMK
jgi:hypothetical protein